MEHINLNNLEKKFVSPEEEIVYLREHIVQRENQLNKIGKSEEEKIITDTIESYSRNNPEKVLEKGVAVPEKIQDEIVLRLSPEEHDDKMSELISVVMEKGILNALSIITKMNDPHISDDFHRFLVQYLKEGYMVEGLKKKSRLSKILARTLFEVTLGNMELSDSKSLEEFIFTMEQFYAGMLSVSVDDSDDYVALEMSNSLGNKQLIFYVSVPNSKINLFEKQLLSVFPTVRITEQPDDFNIFTPDGFSIGTYAQLDVTPAKPIKTYKDFQNDPLKVIVNSFSKLDKVSEAAAIQLIFKPNNGFYEKYYNKALSKIEKGEPAPELNFKDTHGDKVVRGLSSVFGVVSDVLGGVSPSSDTAPISPSNNIDSNLFEKVKSKLSSSIISTNIRIIVSSKDKQRTKDILNEVEASFNQFNDLRGNRIKFLNPKKVNQKTLFKQFIYRKFNKNYDLPLNLSEIATIIHLPGDKTEFSPNVKSSSFKTAPALTDPSYEGISLGTNLNRGLSTKIHFNTNDRLRHFYTIGQTGTGKTNLMKNMIIQDIKNGEGVCMIDPHGSDIQDVLANIPAERHKDVIYFDPANTERPMALNMLEYDPAFPEQKTFVVDELFGIFMKLYSANPESTGPMFEQYFRNAAHLVIEDPETGSTLLDVSRVLVDAEYRNLKLSRCNNPVVKQFWEENADKAAGDASLQNITPYITSKLDVFLTNDVMRPIIAQQKSSFNFRQIMDEKKILLVNLSKGRLGDINSSLIGLIVVGKILMSALSRVDSIARDIPNFYLYIDEFQNVTTDSISTILSEARKYKLSLNIAHQFIAQLNNNIKDAVFGNVGSLAVFRVGADDAKYLESQFEPTFTAKDLMSIDNFNAYVKMLVNGVPTDSFNMLTDKAPDGNMEQVEILKKASSLLYGRDREEVENQINKKYLKKEEASQTKSNDFSSLEI